MNVERPEPELPRGDGQDDAAAGSEADERLPKKFQLELYSRRNQLIIDGTIYAIAWTCAYWIRFEGWRIPWVFEKQLLLWLPYLIAMRLLVNWKLGIYRFIWRYVSLSDAVAIGRALSLFTLFLLACRLLYPMWGFGSRYIHVPLSVIALEFFLSLTGSLGARALRRFHDERQQQAVPAAGQRTPLILVGAGRVGVAVAREIRTRRDAKVVGFLDDDPKKVGSIINGIHVLGPVNSLPSVVKESQAREVVICIPRAPRETMKRLWALCDHLPVRVKIVPTVDEILKGNVNISAFRSVQMADLLSRETMDFSAGIAEVKAAYSGKRILITGAGGSIGTELARQLLDLEPASLIMLDKDENGLHDAYVSLAGGSNGGVMIPVIADIRFADRLEATFTKFSPEIVFHAAAHKHVPLMQLNPSEAILNNVVGTELLIREALSQRAERFVLISTDKAVKPTSVMGATKRLCEMMVRTHSGTDTTHFACVRFGNVMGSRGSVIPLFQQQIARGGPVTVTDAEVRRYLMTIPEAVHLVIQAGTLGALGEIFVLDMGDPVPIVDLARDLIELSGLRPGKDIQIEMTQLRPGEKLAEELIDESSEELLPTRFPKISVVQARSFDAAAFRLRLAALEEAASKERTEDIFRILGEFNFGYRHDEGLRPNPEQEPLEIAKTKDSASPLYGDRGD